MVGQLTNKFRRVAEILVSDPKQLALIAKFKIIRVLQRPLAGPARVTAGGSPRILVDVTITRRFDHRTGIQRVVKSIARAMDEVFPGRTQPVYLGLNTLRNADDFVGRSGYSKNAATVLRPGDSLLMLDSNWSDYGRFKNYFGQIRRGGGGVYTVVYDVIPLTDPSFFDTSLVHQFEGWFKEAILDSDGLICISQNVADEAIALIRKGQLPHRTDLKIGFFHLGADIPPNRTEAALRDEIRLIFEGQRRVLLMVGTIEPRKRHEDALAAMEQLWSEGQDVALCIIGKYGWKSSRIADRLQTHPEKGRRLFWIGDASDAELQFAYQGASALIFPTWAEGYGLPIIEAAYFGLPVLCSDLPVLREVGGEHAIYFPKGEPARIADAIRMFLNGEVKVDPAGIKRLSWAESAHQLLALVQDQTWCATLSSPASASVARSL